MTYSTHLSHYFAHYCHRAKCRIFFRALHSNHIKYHMAHTTTVSLCNCIEINVAIATTHSITLNNYSNSLKLLG